MFTITDTEPVMTEITSKRHSEKLGTIYLICIAVLLVFTTTQCSVHKKTAVEKYPKNKRTEEVVNYAQKFNGTRYKYGGKTPKSGFDCSGFVSYVYKKVDVNLSPASSQMASAGKSIKLKDIRKGDLMFFTGSNAKKRKVGHVALVVNNKSGTIQIIHATTSRGVITETYNTSKYWTARYLFAKRIID